MKTSHIITVLEKAIEKYGDLPFEVSLDIAGIVYEGVASDSGDFFVCKNEYEKIPDCICLGNVGCHESK